MKDEFKETMELLKEKTRLSHDFINELLKIYETNSNITLIINLLNILKLLMTENLYSLNLIDKPSENKLKDSNFTSHSLNQLIYIFKNTTKSNSDLFERLETINFEFNKKSLYEGVSVIDFNKSIKTLIEIIKLIINTKSINMDDIDVIYLTEIPKNKLLLLLKSSSPGDRYKLITETINEIQKLETMEYSSEIYSKIENLFFLFREIFNSITDIEEMFRTFDLLYDLYKTKQLPQIILKKLKLLTFTDKLVEYICINKSHDIIIRSFELTDSFYNAVDNSKLLMKFTAAYSTNDILRIAKIAIKNSDIYNSWHSVPILQKFFQSNITNLDKKTIQELINKGYDIIDETDK